MVWMPEAPKTALAAEICEVRYHTENFKLCPSQPSEHAAGAASEAEKGFQISFQAALAKLCQPHQFRIIGTNGTLTGLGADTVLEPKCYLVKIRLSR